MNSYSGQIQNRLHTCKTKALLITLINLIYFKIKNKKGTTAKYLHSVLSLRFKKSHCTLWHFSNSEIAETQTNVRKFDFTWN